MSDSDAVHHPRFLFVLVIYLHCSVPLDKQHVAIRQDGEFQRFVQSRRQLDPAKRFSSGFPGLLLEQDTSPEISNKMQTCRKL
jgi:hypothetical protein